MSRTTPEIKTKFSLSGIASAAAQLRAFARRVAAIVAPALRAGAALRDAFGARTKAAILSTTATLNRFSFALTKLGVKAGVVGAAIVAGFVAISAAAKAASVAIAGVVGLGAGALIGGGSVALATSSVTEQAAASDAMGTDTAQVAGIRGAATELGVETATAEGWVSSLRAALSDAANGGESKALFDKLGVAATDANGQMRDTVDVLADLDKASARLGSGALKDLFGAEADDVDAFLAQGGINRLKDAASRAIASGAVATGEDVAMIRDFKSAIVDLVNSFKGLALSITRLILPGIKDATRGLAEFISENREIIAERFAAGWDRAMKSMKSAVGVFRLVPIVGRAVVRSMHTMLGVFSDVGHYLSGDYVNIERSWLYELMRAIHATVATFSALADAAGGGLVGAISRAWVGLLHVVVQVVAAFKGLDHVVSSGWILVVRDAVMGLIGILGKIPAYIDALPARMQAVVTAIRAVVAAVQQGIVDAVATLVTVSAMSAEALIRAIEARIQGMYDRIAEATRPAREAIADIWEVLRDGDTARVESPLVAGIREELLSARKVAIDFWESLQKAWAIFRGILDTIHAVIRPVLDLFGTDILTAALVLGMLRLSGILGVVTKGFGWLLGGAGVSGGGVLGGILSGLTAQVSTLLARIGLVGVGGGHLAAAAGIAAGGYALGQAGASALDRMSGGRLSGSGMVDATHARNRARMEDSYYQRLASMPRPQPTSYADINAGNVVDKMDLWSRTPRGSASEVVDVNFNIGRGTSTLSGSRDAVDALVRSLTDARAAGGLR